MTKKETDSLNKLSIFWLKKQGLLISDKLTNATIQWNNVLASDLNSLEIHVSLLDTDSSIRLSYSHINTDGQQTDQNYRVKLAADQCRYGGIRYWFVCPLQVKGKICGKRIAALYYRNGFFGCRKCLNLTYRSQNINRGSKYYPAMAVLDADFKAEELEKNIKRRVYRGIPTKNQLRIDALYEKSVPHLHTVHEMMHEL